MNAQKRILVMITQKKILDMNAQKKILVNVLVKFPMKVIVKMKLIKEKIAVEINY